MPVLKAFLFQTAATLVPTYKKKVPMPTAVASELVTKINKFRIRNTPFDENYNGTTPFELE